eukprot:TRINITY_DN17978_c0_g2_i1.p3 TRINITY_DN17978_c0_g2~~TRINITY_DN17978_c0_g2_i1.p3  ORF type:complete len:187 (-),score=22.38 TRINITY_DN17978_c0_g2_i1:176-736(-)
MFSVRGPDLVADESNGIVKVPDEIRQRDVNFSQKLVSEDSVREEIEVEEEVFALQRRDRIEIEADLVIPFGIPVAVVVDGGFLRLLALRFVGVGCAEGDGGVYGELLEEVEGFEVFAGDHLQIDRIRRFHGWLGGFFFCSGEMNVLVWILGLLMRESIYNYKEEERESERERLEFRSNSKQQDFGK